MLQTFEVSCVQDPKKGRESVDRIILGNLRSLNELAKQANAQHIIHTGDFGFYDDSSLERIAEK